MEGSVLDHATRIVDGKQLYVTPSLEFVNWLYQPFYYYVSAASMMVFGIGYEAGRIVSFCSTVITVTLIYFIVRKISRDRIFTPLVSVFLFIACYKVVGFSFDLARVDALLTLMIIIPTALIFWKVTFFSVISASFFFSLAFFTKQPGIFYFLPFVIWLFYNHRKFSYTFIIASFFLIGIGTFYLILQNGSWYEYYVYTVPRKMASYVNYLSLLKVFPYYLFGAWAIGSVSIIFFISLQFREGFKSAIKSEKGLVILLYLFSIVQLSFNSADAMSASNVALTFSCFSAILFPLAIVHFHSLISRPFSEYLLFLLPIQFIPFFYNPLTEPLLRITDKDIEGGKTFISQLKAMPGDVYIPVHGLMPRFANKKTFANELAMEGVFNVKDQYATDLRKERDAAFTNHKFSCIILDKNSFRYYDSIPRYTYSNLINTGTSSFHSLIGNLPTTPRYVFIPKSVSE